MTTTISETPATLLRILPLLQQVLTRTGVQRTRIGAELGLSDLQIAALGAVGRTGAPTMTELAREMLVIQSTATRIADELVRKGLLKRLNDRNDRRVKRLRLTEKGRNTVEQVREESRYLLGIVMQKMTGEEQESLVRGLEAFIGAFRSAEREAVLRCGKQECADLREAVSKEVNDGEH